MSIEFIEAAARETLAILNSKAVVLKELRAKKEPLASHQLKMELEVNHTTGPTLCPSKMIDTALFSTSACPSRPLQDCSSTPRDPTTMVLSMPSSKSRPIRMTSLSVSRLSSVKSHSEMPFFGSVNALDKINLEV